MDGRKSFQKCMIPSSFSPLGNQSDYLHPLEPLLSWKLSNFSTCILGGQFFLPKRATNGKGNSPNFKIEWDRVFSVPGPFNLDHLHPLEPLLFRKISNFFTFILGDQFSLPRRTNNQKREFFQPHKRKRQRVFSAWGFQTGLFASH